GRRWHGRTSRRASTTVGQRVPDEPSPGRGVLAPAKVLATGGAEPPWLVREPIDPYLTWGTCEQRSGTTPNGPPAQEPTGGGGWQSRPGPGPRPPGPAAAPPRPPRERWAVGPPPGRR